MINMEICPNCKKKCVEVLRTETHFKEECKICHFTYTEEVGCNETI